MVNGTSSLIGQLKVHNSEHAGLISFSPVQIKGGYMHRTDGADNVDNRFTDEIPGTVVTANWLNAVQEEIAGVIEGADISLNSPSADTADQLLAAISSLIDEAVAARVLEDHPIDSVYAQFPAAASNTESVAFPVADRPATKFGGTWTEIFTTSDAFFKVGTTDHQARVNGLSPDQMQRMTGTLGQNETVGYGDFTVDFCFGAFSAGEDNNYRPVAMPAPSPAGQGTSGYATFDSYNSPNARVSSTTAGVTEPRNYRMKIWKRTA